MFPSICPVNKLLIAANSGAIMENVEVDRVLKVSFFALPITYKKYNIYFPYRVYDFLHFSSTENFQFFSKKRPLLEWGFVKNMFFGRVSYIFLVPKMEEFC